MTVPVVTAPRGDAGCGRRAAQRGSGVTGAGARAPAGPAPRRVRQGTPRGGQTAESTAGRPGAPPRLRAPGSGSPRPAPHTLTISGLAGSPFLLPRTATTTAGHTGTEAAAGPPGAVRGRRHRIPVAPGARRNFHAPPRPPALSPAPLPGGTPSLAEAQGHAPERLTDSRREDA